MIKWRIHLRAGRVLAPIDQSPVLARLIAGGWAAHRQLHNLFWNTMAPTLETVELPAAPERAQYRFHLFLRHQPLRGGTLFHNIPQGHLVRLQNQGMACVFWEASTQEERVGEALG